MPFKTLSGLPVLFVIKDGAFHDQGQQTFAFAPPFASPASHLAHASALSYSLIENSASMRFTAVLLLAGAASASLLARDSVPSTLHSHILLLAYSL